MSDEAYRDWIDVLETEVVQDEYGYEPGEFTVYPEIWRGLFDEGLTPSQAFARALDDYGEARDEEEREKHANWERIQAADAALISNDGRAVT